MLRRAEKLKSLEIGYGRLDESYLPSMPPTMRKLSNLQLRCCTLSDTTPIINQLGQPNLSITSIAISHSDIAFDQAEFFVSCLADMQSLTDVNLKINPWRVDDDDIDLERYKKMVGVKVRKLAKFAIAPVSDRQGELMKDSKLHLNLVINRAWRRELCYKQQQSSPPSKLLPLVLTQALRKSEPSLRGDVILSLLRGRIGDCMKLDEQWIRIEAIL